VPGPSKNQFELSNRSTAENSAPVLVYYRVGRLQLTPTFLNVLD
jgi:hypothetical protein